MLFYTATDSIETALDQEQTWVSQYWGNTNLCNNGPNVRKPTLGIKYTSERLDKMSACTTLRFQDNPDLIARASEIALKQWSNPVSGLVMQEKALPNLKLGVQATSQPVVVDNFIYSSIAAAAREYGISGTAALYRVNSKNFPHWRLSSRAPRSDDQQSTHNALVGVSKTVIQASNDLLKDLNMTQGIVIYSDGGCRPNPGPGGWGVHGYLYSTEKPKKGAGNSSNVLTDSGYMLKVDAEKLKPEESREVTPIHYVNGYGSFAPPITNNIGELGGAIAGLQYAAGYDITEATIITDSEYVRKGIEGWIHGWQRNGWLRADGMPVANVDFWKQLIAAKELLTQRGVSVVFKWIKAHSGLDGNEHADRLATTAVFTSKRGLVRTEITVQPAEGYWGYGAEKHPFIHHRRMYFNTDPAYNKAGEYYLGEHGKDDDLLGKRLADGAFSVIQLSQPDAVLELVREHQAKLAMGANTIMMARLDAIYQADTHRELALFGVASLNQKQAHRLDLENVKEDPVTYEYRPTRLSTRAEEAIQELGKYLDLYVAGDASLIKTDLTSILYESTLKSGKKGAPETSVMKLKADYNVGFAALEVQANYQNGDHVSAAPVTLTLGIDLLDRNALKRLETLNPKVTLISWNEAPTVFRYATVIEAGADRGIWAGVYSNLRFITA